jgi:pimeloyl-ACP methyl ester carboxylesterase
MKLHIHDHEVYAYTGGKPFDAALPTLVLVHGAMGDHGVWNLLARWFAHHGHSVLAVDLPGHMRSAGPALASIEDMADWLLRVLKAAGVQRAALAGHSMGSLIALEAAARATHSDAATQGPIIDHLIMLGTAVPMPVPQVLLDLSLKDTHAAIDRVVGFSFSTLAAKPSFPGPGTWLRGSARSLMRMVAAGSPDKALFHNDFSACNQYVAGETSAPKVGCKAHLILGELDQMTAPRSAQSIAKALKAEVNYVRAGHYLMQEAPDEVLNAMRRALA